MEFKGTKGKWIGRENEGVFLENGDAVFETGCGCCTGKYLDKYDANLIAHAPEMLEMLKYVFDSISMQDEIEYGSEMHSKIEQLINSATNPQF